MNESKLILIFGLFAFIAFSVWMAKRRGVTAEYETEEKQLETNLDEPIDFGYKINWIAVKCKDSNELLEFLGIKKGKPANWKTGIVSAYHNKVYITPIIGEWAFIVGLPSTEREINLDKISRLLNKLSLEYNEAQFFGNYRGVDYYAWMSSIEGKSIRSFSSDQETAITFNFGDFTQIEIDLKLFKSSISNHHPEEEKHINEDTVLEISENWSINPNTLSNRSDFKIGLGTVLSFNEIKV